MDAMIHKDRAKITWTILDVLRGGRWRVLMYRFLWAGNWGWWLKAVKEVHDFVNPHIWNTYKEIDERKERVEKGLPVGPERTDLLWFMASELRHDEELLRSQLCLIFVPNNDTTSIFICNCLWHLARHPGAWAKLREEVASLGDTPVTFEVIRNMKFLNGVLNESTYRMLFCPSIHRCSG